MKILDEIRQLTDSLQLAELGARPPVISALTGIHRAKAIQIFREVHGVVPKGSLHVTADWIFKSRRQNLVCTQFLIRYQGHLENGDGHIAAFIRAYQELEAKAQLSIDHAWVVIQEHDLKEIKLVKCRVCYTQYLLHNLDLQIDHKCPQCSGKGNIQLNQIPASHPIALAA